MMNEDPVPSLKDTSSITLDTVISCLTQSRIQLIRQLLKREALFAYLEDRYSVFAISAIKEEFMKRDLAVLAEAPLDLVMYATLIQEVKARPVPTLEERHEVYFHKEIELIIRKYCS